LLDIGVSTRSTVNDFKSLAFSNRGGVLSLVHEATWGVDEITSTEFLFTESVVAATRLTSEVSTELGFSTVWRNQTGTWHWDTPEFSQIQEESTHTGSGDGSLFSDVGLLSGAWVELRIVVARNCSNWALLTLLSVTVIDEVAIVAQLSVSVGKSHGSGWGLAFDSRKGSNEHILCWKWSSRTVSTKDTSGSIDRSG
jgi:hypothetical protein